MIDVKFWKSVADNWHKDDDGIKIPDINTEGIDVIDPSSLLFDTGMDEEIDDILADMGFDDL